MNNHEQLDQLMLSEEVIMNKIYFIRGQKVMLERDLAELYVVETKQLKRAVRRNKKRFPVDFMFELTKKELENWRCQFGTSNKEILGLRILPFAFTEQGVAMLSSILNSDKAIMVNIQIIRIFSKIRELLTDNLSLRIEIEEIKKKIRNHDKNIELVFNYLDELIEKQNNPEPRKVIGFKEFDK